MHTLALSSHKLIFTWDLVSPETFFELAVFLQHCYIYTWCIKCKYVNTNYLNSETCFNCFFHTDLTYQSFPPLPTPSSFIYINFQHSFFYIIQQNFLTLRSSNPPLNIITHPHRIDQVMSILSILLKISLTPILTIPIFTFFHYPIHVHIENPWAMSPLSYITINFIWLTLTLFLLLHKINYQNMYS